MTPINTDLHFNFNTEWGKSKPRYSLSKIECVVSLAYLIQSIILLSPFLFKTVSTLLFIIPALSKFRHHAPSSEPSSVTFPTKFAANDF